PRHGTRAVMTVVALLFGLACAFIGVSTALVKQFDTGQQTYTLLSLAVLTFSFFFLRFLGQGALGLTSSHALAMWFERRLGFVESIRHLGMPLAVAVLPGAILLLIDTTGWRAAYAILGVCVWAIVLPLLWIAYVNRPEDMGQNIDADPHPHPRHLNKDEIDVEIDAPSIGDAGHSFDIESISETAGAHHQFTLNEAMRTRAYWIVTASMVLSAAVGTSFVFHIQPMVADLGLSKSTSAAVVGTFGVVSLIVTVPFGHLVDRFRPRMLLAASGLALGSASASYALAGSLDAYTLFSISATALMLHLAFLLLGLSQGMLFVLASPIFARYYGRTHHGAIRGSLTTFMVIGTSAGPFVFSFWRDFSGNFNQVYLASALVAIVLAVWATRLQRPGQTT
ncbi:MAG: MFS transporter, partial [Phycisphaerales bacterium]